MCRLVWAFADRTYHIFGNLMSQLISYNQQKCILTWCGVFYKQIADIKCLQFVCLTLHTNSFIHLFQLLTDAGYQWRLAKNTFQLSGIYGAQGDTEKKKEYIYTSLDIATVALGLDEQCAESHKWYN